MDLLISLVLGAGVLLGVERLWPARPAEGALPPQPVAPDGIEAAAVESGLFTPAFVQARMRALAAELDRLDHDPDVFARAFHTLAAREAYQALAVEAARQAEELRRSPGPVLEEVSAGMTGGRREVLEL
ncbi:MAG TPA: hypothetical protein VFP72_09645 [Kineosporiaceae bacterium]|nr:hypothetical protein [Kineosporiaceae bacterium]